MGCGLQKALKNARKSKEFVSLFFVVKMSKLKKNNHSAAIKIKG